jgi:hypothetical protein
MLIHEDKQKYKEKSVLSVLCLCFSQSQLPRKKKKKKKKRKKRKQQRRKGRETHDRGHGEVPADGDFVPLPALLLSFPSLDFCAEVMPDSTRIDIFPSENPGIFGSAFLDSFHSLPALLPSCLPFSAVLMLSGGDSGMLKISCYSVRQTIGLERKQK